MSEETLPVRDTRVTRFNSIRFGLRSAYTVLPWENREAYEALCQALIDHHNPVGPTETHLVAEVAGIIWRQQRVRMAEGAVYRKELAEEVRNNYRAEDSVQAAIVGKAPACLRMGKVSLASTVGPAEDRAAIAQAAEALKQVMKIRAKLEKETDYAKALTRLPEEVRETYEIEYLGEQLELDDGTQFTYEKLPGDLVFYLDNELIPRLEAQAMQHRYAEDIANQLKGQAFNPEKLELIGRYETHLDRKLERMLAMLLKMQELRLKGGSV